MVNDIFRENDIIKIFMVYENKTKDKIREIVQLKYLDQKECYFMSDLPINFEKPQKRTHIELFVYTPNGVYKSETSIIEANVAGNKVFYQTKVPKVWTLVQLRAGSRKRVSIKGTLSFEDGTKFAIKLFDLSISGFSCFSETPIPVVYQKFNADVELNFDKPLDESLPDNKLTMIAKCRREAKTVHYEYYKSPMLYAFKFSRLGSLESIALKNYLINLD